jgi:hypothetical protein
MLPPIRARATPRVVAREVKEFVVEKLARLHGDMETKLKSDLLIRTRAAPDRNRNWTLSKSRK